MKETTQPPKDPKKKLWIGYAIILAIVILSNVFLFPALMQASVKSVNYSTFLQMLESKELATVQIEDQQIYFVDKNDNSYKTNAIAQDNNLVTRLQLLRPAGLPGRHAVRRQVRREAVRSGR